MSDARIALELVVAITVAMLVVRFWRQIVAFVIGVFITLSVIGLFTVISWFQALSRS